MFWEIVNRVERGEEEEASYQPPYWDMVGIDPSIEEMRKVSPFFIIKLVNTMGHCGRKCCGAGRSIGSGVLHLRGDQIWLLNGIKRIVNAKTSLALRGSALLHQIRTWECRICLLVPWSRSHHGAHWGYVQLNYGPKPITQAVVVLHQ